jgi:hypothetical protein
LHLGGWIESAGTQKIVKTQKKIYASCEPEAYGRKEFTSFFPPCGFLKNSRSLHINVIAQKDRARFLNICKKKSSSLSQSICKLALFVFPAATLTLMDGC